MYLKLPSITEYDVPVNALRFATILVTSEPALFTTLDFCGDTKHIQSFLDLATLS